MQLLVFDVEYDKLFIQNTNILMTRVPKTKDLVSAQSLTITSKVGFQTMFFYINFGTYVI